MCGSLDLSGLVKTLSYFHCQTSQSRVKTFKIWWLDELLLCTCVVCKNWVISRGITVHKRYNTFTDTVSYLIQNREARKRAVLLRLKRRKNRVVTLNLIEGQWQFCLCLESCTRNNCAQLRQELKINRCYWFTIFYLFQQIVVMSHYAWTLCFMV